MTWCLPLHVMELIIYYITFHNTVKMSWFHIFNIAKKQNTVFSHRQFHFRLVHGIYIQCYNNDFYNRLSKLIVILMGFISVKLCRVTILLMIVVTMGLVIAKCIVGILNGNSIDEFSVQRNSFCWFQMLIRWTVNFKKSQFL